MATVMNVLFDVNETRLLSDLPAPVLNAVTTGKPIAELH